MFVNSSDEEELVSDEEDILEGHVDLELQPGEKGLPVGHRGKNFSVQEGWRRNTKVYVSGSWGYTFENQNKKKSARSQHPVIHLKCHCWAPKYGKCPARAQIDERGRLTQKAGPAHEHNHSEVESQRKLASLRLQVNNVLLKVLDYNSRFLKYFYVHYNFEKYL